LAARHRFVILENGDSNPHESDRQSKIYKK